MRSTPNLKIENFRHDGPANTNYGFFVIPHRGFILRAQSSCGGGWDHVSVSLAARCPTWEEMCYVKRLFFRDDEAAMQLHVAASEHINCHPYCLHLWRPQTDAEIAAAKSMYAAEGETWPYSDESPGSIPLPPAMFVGPRTTQEALSCP